MFVVKQQQQNKMLLLIQIYWNKISWQHGKDANYRGAFDNTYSYKLGNIAAHGNALWKAVTNIAVAAVVPSVQTTPGQALLLILIM